MSQNMLEKQILKDHQETLHTLFQKEIDSKSNSKTTDNNCNEDSTMEYFALFQSLKNTKKDMNYIKKINMKI